MIKILAVIIIMVIVNLVMVFAIVKAAGRVESAVRKFYIARLGDEEQKTEDRKSKDVLMFTSSQGTEEKKAETAVQKIPAAQSIPEVTVSYASGSGPDNGKARYKNSAFREDYRIMRRMDLLDKNAALSRVVRIQEQKEEKESVYERILKILDFDTAFRLNSYSPEEQERLLRETMDPSMIKVLDSFLAVEAGSFSAVDFYSFLKEQAALNSNTYVVMRAEGAGETIKAGANVRTVEDAEITEGVKIIYKNKLYDYSV